jgi:hypothetical protein
MLWLVLGGLTVFVLVAGLSAFERASTATIKSLLAWIAALAGLSLAALLFLSGRGGIAFGPLLMFGPLIWRRLRGVLLAKPPASGPAPGPPPPGPQPRRGSSAMTLDEAYEVLGLAPGASQADVRAAHRRLMRVAHPDTGGSDWIAARVNQARDLLLKHAS